MNTATSSPSMQEASTTEGVADAAPGLGDIVEVNRARAPVPPMRVLEDLIGQGQWAKVAETLAPVATSMPAGHRLVYALALKEQGAEGDAARGADAMSIRALAELLDVPPESPVALLLARRMQRRNWRQAPAPKGRVQIALVVSAVLIGAFVGWAWDEWNDRRTSRASVVARP